MRDVETLNAVRTYKRIAGPPYGNAMRCGDDPVLQTIRGSYLKSAKGRSKVVKSNHISATPYLAYRYSARPGDVDFYRRHMHTTLTSCKSNASRYFYPTQRYVGEYQSAPKSVWGLNSAFIIIPDNNARTLCINRLSRAVSSSEADLGTAVAELVTDYNRTAGQVMKLGRALWLLKSGKPQKALKALGLSKKTLPKGLSDWYLAWIFGIKPLVQTVQEALPAIRDSYISDKREILSKSAFADYEKPPRTSTVNDFSGTFEGRYRAKVTYTVADADKHRLQRLGLLNPFYTAWQLVPFSFIVDWFISVNDFLNGLTAYVGLSFRSGYVTQYCRTTHRWTLKNPPASSSSHMIGTLPYSEYTEFGFRREVLVTFPSPGVGFKLPTNPKLLLSIGALAIQMAH